MTRKTLISLMIALALLGLADAWYLADSALTGAALTCSIAGLDGCNVVAQSPYSHFFGVPLGVYGLVFYGFFLLLSVYAFFIFTRAIAVLLAALGLVGLLASVYFLYIQLALIKALCVYCLGSALIAVLLAWACAWLYFLVRSEPLNPASTV